MPPRKARTPIPDGSERPRVFLDIAVITSPPLSAAEGGTVPVESSVLPHPTYLKGKGCSSSSDGGVPYSTTEGGVLRLGRLVFELQTDSHPKTSENFKALCLGSSIPGDKKGARDGRVFSYQGCRFTRFTEDGMMTGDIHRGKIDNLEDLLAAAEAVSRGSSVAEQAGPDPATADHRGASGRKGAPLKAVTGKRQSGNLAVAKKEGKGQRGGNDSTARLAVMSAAEIQATQSIYGPCFGDEAMELTTSADGGAAVAARVSISPLGSSYPHNPYNLSSSLFFRFGTLVMCNSGPDTSGCSFMICTHKPHPYDFEATRARTEHLRSHYVPFGQLVSGFEVLEELEARMAAVIDAVSSKTGAAGDNPAIFGVVGAAEWGTGFANNAGGLTSNSSSATGKRQPGVSNGSRPTSGNNNTGGNNEPYAKHSPSLPPTAFPPLLPPSSPNPSVISAALKFKLIPEESGVLPSVGFPPNFFASPYPQFVISRCGTIAQSATPPRTDSPSAPTGVIAAATKKVGKGK